MYIAALSLVRFLACMDMNLCDTAIDMMQQCGLAAAVNHSNFQHGNSHFR
jgi:hypothetical protein